MKGTLKLNSVAEEEKSKLVLVKEVEAPPLPPLIFLSVMAAGHSPLHVYWKPVQYHRPETSHLGVSALPHLRTGTSGGRSRAIFSLLCAARNKHGGASFMPKHSI